MSRRSLLPGLILIAAGLALLGFAASQWARSSEAPAVEIQREAVFPTATPSVVESPTSAPTARPTATIAPVQPTEFQVEPTAAPALPSPPAVLSPIPTLAPAPAVAPLRSLPAPVRVIISRIAVDAPVVNMGWDMIEQNGETTAVWRVPKDEVGHAINSANPGERGNVVLSGHNNLGAAVFRKLYALKPGDEIKIYNAAGLGYLYRVDQSYIVPEAGVPMATREQNAQVLLPTKDARMTLTSCWPETSNTHRAIVIAFLAGALQ